MLMVRLPCCALARNVQRRAGVKTAPLFENEEARKRTRIKRLNFSKNALCLALAKAARNWKRAGMATQFQRKIYQLKAYQQRLY